MHVKNLLVLIFGIIILFMVSCTSQNSFDVISPAVAEINNATTLTLQAENAVISGGDAASSYSGYSGTGYADMTGTSGSYVEFTVNATAAGSASLKIYYANGTGSSVNYNVTVNGSGSSKSFSSGSWTTWSSTSRSVTLVSGSNTIRITATAATTDGVNFDRIEVTGSVGTASSSTVTSSSSKSSSVTGSSSSNNSSSAKSSSVVSSSSAKSSSSIKSSSSVSFSTSSVVSSITSSSSTSTSVIQIFIASDSTASLYATSKYPRMGWGQPFGDYFNSSISVVDTAKSGASSTSFQTTTNYATIKSQIKSGDYLMIQFGHNDENSNPAATTFTEALKVYLDFAESVGAHPILITPVQRRHFNADGTMKNSHITSAGGDYPQAVRDLATARNIPLIDLTARSMTFFEAIGDEGSKAYYLYVLASEGYSGYTSDTEDDTHFREKGAIAVGQLVIDGLKDINSPLINYLK
jgi:lysophospholipase L1-like esterase